MVFLIALVLIVAALAVLGVLAEYNDQLLALFEGRTGPRKKRSVKRGSEKIRRSGFSLYIPSDSNEEVKLKTNFPAAG